MARNRRGQDRDDGAFGPLEPIIESRPPRRSKPDSEPMRLNLSSLLLVVLIVAAAFFVTAPWFAFRNIRDAAKTNDVPALAELIDYTAVRQGLADQLSGRPPPQTPPPDVWRDPIGALKNALKPVPAAPPETERYVTPRGISALAAGRSPANPLPAGVKEPFPMIAFWGPDRCRITVADPLNKSRKTEFTFQRRGIYNWKLVRIILPARPAAPKPAAPAKS